MKQECKAGDVWWNNLGELQKGIVRLIVQLIGDTEENGAVEITRDQGQLRAKVVDRTATVSAG